MIYLPSILSLAPGRYPAECPRPRRGGEIPDPRGNASGWQASQSAHAGGLAASAGLLVVGYLARKELQGFISFTAEITFHNHHVFFPLSLSLLFGNLFLAHSFPTKPSASSFNHPNLHPIHEAMAGAALFGGNEAGWVREILAARLSLL